MGTASKEEDRQLVGQALAGKQRGYRDLVSKYQRPVFSIILRMVRNRATAEDLAQEAFVKAFRALGSFDLERKFSSWLFTIAHNTAIDHLRRKSPPLLPLETQDEEQPDLLAFLATPAEDSPEGRALRGDLLRAIESALEGLRPEYAEVLILRFQEGLAYEEISQVTSLPLGTVKTHIFRARKELARQLRARGWRPEGGPSSGV